MKYKNHILAIISLFFINIYLTNTDNYFCNTQCGIENAACYGEVFNYKLKLIFTNFILLNLC